MNTTIIRSVVKTTFLTVLMLLATSFAAAQDMPKCSEANGLKQSEMKDILKAHNSARDSVDASKLTWDCALAARAQAAADAAVGGSASTSAPGENRISSYDSSLDVKGAVDLWREERRDWDTKAGTCDPGRACNHWAQMIFTSTTKVGCGVNRKGKGSTKAVLVCTYDTARP